MKNGRKYKQAVALALLAIGLTQGNAVQASLVDRGNGMLYDNILNVTWLQDANYAHTSGYALALGDGTGEMSWKDATTWAANLIYGGYSDWRLASHTPINGTSYNGGQSTNGTTDRGYNITSPNSEMSYMYYVNLGLKGWLDSSGKNVLPNFGIFGNGTLGYGLQNNVGLVHNLQSYTYWSGSEFYAGATFAFDNSDGLQWIYSNRDTVDINGDPPYTFYAWAVHPGDVAAVPVPGAVWLFGSGLMGLLRLKKRKAA